MEYRLSQGKTPVVLWKERTPQKALPEKNSLVTTGDKIVLNLNMPSYKTHINYDTDGDCNKYIKGYNEVFHAPKLTFLFA